MSSSSLMRLGGLATMLAGALLIISTIPTLMGVIGLDLTLFAEEATTGSHALHTRLGVLATILLQAGWRHCTPIGRRLWASWGWWASSPPSWARAER